jgi:hypothetical protein
MANALLRFLEIYSNKAKHDGSRNNPRANRRPALVMARNLT